MMLLSHTPDQFTSFFQPYWLPKSDGPFERKTMDLLPQEVLDAIIWLSDDGEQLLKEFVDSRAAMVTEAEQRWSAPSSNAELTAEQKAVKFAPHCKPQQSSTCVTVGVLGGGQFSPSTSSVPSFPLSPSLWHPQGPLSNHGVCSRARATGLVTRSMSPTMP